MALACRDIPERAGPYIDREGPIASRLAVAMHLALCGHCRTYVQGLRITRRLVAESLRAEISPALAARLGIAGTDPDKDGTP